VRGNPLATLPVHDAVDAVTGCPACGGVEMTPFLEIPDVPANSCVLLDSEAEALAYPRGDLVLGLCESCGFIQNLAFDPRLVRYAERYEGTQSFSPTFRRFHRHLADRLIERHALRDRKLIEIGCGQGEFLALLCELGPNRGTGYDPAYDPGRGLLEGVPGATARAGMFSAADADGSADLVCCKMTLEHVRDAGEFVGLARRALREDAGAVAYFLVPETLRILRDCAFEDIYYEHCSYFTPGSLARLFRDRGFRVLDLRTEYDGQYLGIEAGVQAGALAGGFADAGASGDPGVEEEPPGEVAALAGSLAARYDRKVAEWRNRLADASEDGPVAVWGSGSKAVTFLRSVDPEGVVRHVVDINPHRHGRYLPGSGRRVDPPGRLSDEPPAHVVVMNPIYLGEVARQLADLGLEPELSTP